MDAQVLVPVPETAARLAGLPGPMRSAHRLASEIPGLKVILRPSPRPERTFRSAAGRSGSALDPAQRLESMWGRILDRPPGLLLGARMDEARPVLAVSPDGLLDPKALRELLGRVDGRPASWVWRGKVVAAYYPKAARLPDDPLARPPKDSLAVPEGGWTPLSSEPERLAAEEGLFKVMVSESDGYIARHDRRLSMALSRLLVRTPVTPNQITSASLLIGILGAWALTTTSYPAQVAGALLLCSCCILDGSDGEVARLKLQSSRAGALYDTLADHAAALITLAGIVLHIKNNRPGLPWALPAGLMFAGVVVSMHAVWRLILSRPASVTGPQRVFERLASRDYVYLVLVLVLLGRLHWVLWSGAVGANVFWAALWLVTLRSPPTLRS